MDRRKFIQGSVLTAASLATSLSPQSAGAATLPGRSSAPTGGAIDVSVNLFQWPFRRLGNDVTSKLLAKLKRNGVTEAWAGTFEGLLHKDVAAANTRLAEECRSRGEGMLVPFGSVNPTLPDWAEDVRRCHEDHRMPGIRLHPAYHGYDLNDPEFAAVLAAAAERRLIVQLVVAVEDERSHHPRMQVPAVNLEPLPELLGSSPDVSIVILNGFRTPRGPVPARLAETGRVAFDIAWLDTIRCVSDLLEKIPVETVLFGTHAPFFHVEATPLKLKESDLTAAQMTAISRRNAERILADASPWVRRTEGSLS